MAKIHSLQHINQSIQTKFKGRKLVFGRGVPGAEIVFVGESPDVHEEKEGKAFTGPTGKMLNQFLKSINLDMRKVYATHVLKYRPSTEKVPTQKEIKSHMPFLKEELKTINPKIVVTLGTMALNGIGLKLPLSNVHGRVFNFGHYELLPTYNPNHATTDPQVEAMLKVEFQRLKDLIEKKKKEGNGISTT